MTRRPHQAKRPSFQIEGLEDRRLMAASQPVKSPVDDAYEENDTLATARALGAVTSATAFKNLAMADKADWYSISLGGARSPATIDLKFTHASGDLDLKLVNSAGKEVKSSLGKTNAETISLKGVAAGTYYIQVFGKSGALNPNYELSFASGTAPAPTADLQGQSALAANAASWGGVFTIESQIKNAGSKDSGAFNVQWYLSKDAAGSTDDVLLSLADGSTSYAHASIPPSSSGGKQNISLKLPKVAPSGFAGENFYVIMKADSAAQVAESNENNNFGQLGDGVDRDKIVIGGKSTSFSSFDAWDASTDDSVNTVFADGVLRVSYGFNLTNVTGVTLQAIGQGGVVKTIANFGAAASGTNKLVNLASSPLAAGQWQLRLKATTNSGTHYSSVDSITVLDSGYVANGSAFAETFVYAGGAGSGQVYRGGGGTDTFDLKIARSEIASINGYPGFFNNITANQAIYKGSAFDFIRLVDGREIYFQGMERLKFADGSLQELAVHPYDGHFGDQWNLHVTDVPSAWRFTQGSSNVMLVSLDSGVFNSTSSPAYHGVYDFNTTRFIAGADAAEDDWEPQHYWGGDGHGHMAVSIMAAQDNNADGIAGINWNSSVYITDIDRGGSYGNGMSLYQAISDAIAYGRANGKKVVFQGGIQGETWLNGTAEDLQKHQWWNQADLTSLISNNSDIALFAIAAGNGGPNGGLNDPNWQTSVSGVAKFEAYFGNVMSVGALQPTVLSNVDGLVNAWGVDIAGYSNRGSNLTLMAPTNSLAIDKQHMAAMFGGTSAANPNLAAIASLVWSVNPALTPEGVRQILVDTAHDLGAAGDDNTFGNGLVNADAAVRRAVALARAGDLANLYPNKPLQLFSGSAASTAGSSAKATGGGGLLAGLSPSTETRAAQTGKSVNAKTMASVVATMPQTSTTKDLAFGGLWHSSPVNRITKLAAHDQLDSFAPHDADHDEVFSLLGAQRLTASLARS